MSKTDAQSELVPRLRFPEFNSKPPWSPRRLGDVLSFQPGYPFPSSGFNENGVGLRLIRNRDLRSDNAVIYYSSDYDEAFVVNDGDVLIGMDGDFTPCVWRKGRALLNQRVGRIKPKGANNLQFLRFFLTVHLKDIEDATPRTTVKHLSHSDVERLNEALPEPDEQQKIADTLGSVDSIIEAEQAQLDDLTRHKQGLMQQLFPSEGQNRPNLRFPEFQKAGKWKDTTLNHVCELKAGDFVRASDISDLRTEGMFPCYGGNGLRGFVTTYTHRGRFVLVGRQGALCGNVNLVDETFHATEHALVATPMPNVINDWLFYSLAHLNLNRFAIGQAQPGLSVSVLNSVRVQVPIEEDEQLRIADCLSSLDELIASRADRLVALRSHKRGLMQQLFPAQEGVQP